ncbi:hypothetical protein NI389_04315 [Pseudoalteromonas xiamenensis]|uniref:hypothetical protein n=1 Tax=Pseudoalteromonas xiamenensis TaxID=882626 RepID=UPI0027E4D8F3|nr:hypothetical protein [Pseudoalteromonas xiamenensis]WMN60638.1 hypothetical protein NI389_04315 [Pseudoalteromonas xiamenensis]
MRFKITLALIACMASIAAAAGSQSADKTKPARLIAYSDCQPILDVPLNELQLAAYDRLKEQQREFDRVAIPLKKVDELIQSHDDEIADIRHAYADVAERENDNQRRMEAASQKLDRALAGMASELKQIDVQSDALQMAATAFDNTIEPTLAGLDYDQIQILRENQTSRMYCNGVAVNH